MKETYVLVDNVNVIIVERPCQRDYDIVRTREREGKRDSGGQRLIRPLRPLVVQEQTTHRRFLQGEEENPSMLPANHHQDGESILNKVVFVSEKFPSIFLCAKMQDLIFTKKINNFLYFLCKHFLILIIRLSLFIR